MAGYDFLQNLGGVTAAKQAAGIDTTSAPSTLDMANAAGQTALMAANPLGRGSNLAGRVAGSVVDGASKGAVQSAANDTGALVQGGNLGADPVGSILSHALDAGVAGAATGAAMGFPIEAARASAGAVGDALVSRKAGPEMQAFAAETAPWNAALQRARASLQQSQPNLNPTALDEQAYRLAQQGTPGNPGVAPPSSDTLSPAAMNGMAQKAAIEMYDQRRQAVTVGMGRPDYDPAPTQVFKGILGDVTRNLNDTARLLKQAGIIDPGQAKTLTDAISEAAKHNAAAGEGGDQVGYFDTLRDKVAAIPLDPPMATQIMSMLRVADIASQASLYKNSKGPLERNADMILPALGAGAAALTHGASAITGGMAGRLFQAQGVSALRGLDSVMGNGLPDLLQRRAAIEQFSRTNGLSSVADPMALK